MDVILHPVKGKAESRAAAGGSSPGLIHHRNAKACRHFRTVFDGLVQHRTGLGNIGIHNQGIHFLIQFIYRDSRSQRALDGVIVKPLHPLRRSGKPHHGTGTGPGSGEQFVRCSRNQRPVRFRRILLAQVQGHVICYCGRLRIQIVPGKAGSRFRVKGCIGVLPVRIHRIVIGKA